MKLLEPRALAALTRNSEKQDKGVLLNVAILGDEEIMEGKRDI